MSDETIRDEVREYYREAAETRRAAGPTDQRWGAARYDAEVLADADEVAAKLSMGCGNPYALADLDDSETVLDLGSGGGWTS